VNGFNDLWHLEYYAGSQRDQVSCMYSLWHTNLQPYLIWQNPRKNSYFTKQSHFLTGPSKQTNNFLPDEKSDLQSLIKILPNGIEMALVNSKSEDLVHIFSTSNKIKHLSRVVGDQIDDKGVINHEKRRCPDIIDNTNRNVVEANQIPDNSLDFVFIDAPHDYKPTMQYIDNWRRKVKAGGFIGGQNYSNKFQGVVRAIYEQLGNPDNVFADGTWLFNIVESPFGIVSYCSLSYLDAFEFSIDSWFRNGRASEVIIYTDSPEFEKRAKHRQNVSFVQAFTTPVEDLPEIPWQRKIQVIHKYYKTTSQPYFAYLDCDCWVRDDFREVFQSMNQAKIVGTRLLGRDKRGKGEANAGVIFFRNDPILTKFFKLWNDRAEYYYKKNHDAFYEQDSLSHLIIEAFDGLHAFQASLVSEHIYNCEHDSDNQWLQDIRRYQPKIIHFKAKRFRNDGLKQAAFSQLQQK
jgi:hypothetical protein